MKGLRMENREPGMEDSEPVNLTILSFAGFPFLIPGSIFSLVRPR